jgi:hypothetical protein
MNGIEISMNKPPYVYVKINHIKTDDDYYSFENTWLNLYENMEEFIFIINIKDVGTVNMVYVYKLVQLIRQLKNKNKQYLKYSVFIVNTYFIKQLLNIIFMITPPVAPIYIVDKAEYYKDLISDIKNGKELKSTIKYVSP